MSAELTSCLHCGTAFVPHEREKKFCCAGCRFVHDWIEQEGLDRFYDLKGSRVTEAVGNAVFEPADWEWVERLQENAEESGESPSVEIGLHGMSCLACAWLIERRFSGQPGSLRIDVFPERGIAKVKWIAGEFSLADFCKDLTRFGYRAVEASEASAQTAEAERGFMTRLGVCAAFAMNTMAFTLPSYFGMERGSELATLFELVAFSSATLAVLVGGSYFFQHAWQALRDRVMHVDLPIALGIGVAYLGSVVGWFGGIEELFYVDFVATFVFLMLLGRWVQQRALARAQRQLADRTAGLFGGLKKIQANGERTGIAVDSVAKDDLLRVSAGNVVPVESVVEDVAVNVSLEWINGEPEPLLLEPGQIAPAGAKVLSREGAVFRARQAYADGLLSKLIGQAATGRDRLLERVLQSYLAIVLVVAFGGAIGWWIASGAAMALSVFVAVLVVSCPCALGVAIPLINSLTARFLERHGVFIRDSSLWSRLSRVRQIVFDKTGTLTLPAPKLRNAEAIDQLDEERRRRLWQLVADNRHPVARSLHEALLATGERGGAECEVEEVPGRGARLCDEAGVEWSLGQTGWLVSAENSRESDVVFGRNGEEMVSFQFEEALRPDAESELNVLRKAGVALAILSGDRAEKVSGVAELLGIEPDRALGGLKPDGKADWLSQNDGGRSLFIGDGANDSLGFDAALCSGMPASNQGVLEAKADFCFLGRGLRALRRLFEASRRRQVALMRVFVLAVLYNVAAVGACLAGWMNPLLAAVLMPLSSVAILAVAAISLRSKPLS